eukprot:EG_transcript_34579
MKIHFMEALHRPCRGHNTRRFSAEKLIGSLHPHLMGAGFLGTDGYTGVQCRSRRDTDTVTCPGDGSTVLWRTVLRNLAPKKLTLVGGNDWPLARNGTLVRVRG